MFSFHLALKCNFQEHNSIKKVFWRGAQLIPKAIVGGKEGILPTPALPHKISAAAPKLIMLATRLLLQLCFCMGPRRPPATNRSAYRTTTGGCHQSHQYAKPLLKQHHRLQIKNRISYKVAVLIRLKFNWFEMTTNDSLFQHVS